ncbi:hypothetical protein BDR04DRAFT_1123282 [Suillus decipiens]|nr:hypothetical protein BDR04DRAFT_1123282 [Suillus decipiens]
MSIYSDKQGYTRPPYLLLNWLENSFPSEEALAAQIADTRRHMLDQYRFIIFNWVTLVSLAIEPLHLHTLLMRYILIYYQWFPTSTGPFNPKALRATDCDMTTHLKPQMTLAFALRKGKECKASPKCLAGPVQKKPAKYIAVEKVGEEGKDHCISKNEHKRLTQWCQGMHKSLPGGDIFYAYKNDAEDEDNAMPAGPVMMAKAAHEARMADCSIFKNHQGFLHPQGWFFQLQRIDLRKNHQGFLHPQGWFFQLQRIDLRLSLTSV